MAKCGVKVSWEKVPNLLSNSLPSEICQLAENLSKHAIRLKSATKFSEAMDCIVQIGKQLEAQDYIYKFKYIDYDM
jgi:hypothetical protein